MGLLLSGWIGQVSLVLLIVYDIGWNVISVTVQKLCSVMAYARNA
jgi:hypothetical protein